MTLSAVLAVRDEEQMLEGALRSLSFCDEIVVVIDNRSSDRTEEIARRYAHKVLVEPFEDFAQIRNVGIREASGSWILHVDADERISRELAREMRAVVDSDPHKLAFRDPSINFFWGRRMRYGGWGAIYQVRLVRHEHAEFVGRVHEIPVIPPDQIGTLHGERWHFTHRSIEENLRKAVLYGRLDAQDRFERGEKPVTPWTFVRVMALEFGRRAIRRVGFRDGMPGIIEIIFQPFALFCAQVMLWELQQGDDIRRRYQEFEREFERQAD